MPLAGSSSALKSGTSTPLQVVPFQAMSLRDRIEGLAGGIAGGAVVQTRRLAGHAHDQLTGLADAGRIRIIPPRHEVAGLGPRRRRRSSTRRTSSHRPQFREPGELLAGLAHDLGRVLGVRDIVECAAVVLPGDLLGGRFLRMRIGPGELHDGVRKRAAFGLIELAQDARTART